MRMIPGQPRAGANKSEQALFQALEGIPDRPNWAVIHSLSLTDNLFSIAGEADFVVFVPWKGILVIEAKSPNYAEYKDGDWYLDKTPKPHKSPLEQLNKATASIHRFLDNRGLYNDVPIARLVWFTSLSRFQFINNSPGDMQFFEWELALSEDLQDPVPIIEKVLDEYTKSHVDRRDLTLSPADFDEAAAKLAVGALINDFKLYRTADDRYTERTIALRKILEEQTTILDTFEDNLHVYVDGAAGTGKSFILMEAARRLSKRGIRTLVACWNVMMAEELKRELGLRPNLDVFDLNTLMLQIYGLQGNPKVATSEWYESTLPSRAVEALIKRPELAEYDAILIDEFQDIAGNNRILEFLIEATSTKSSDETILIFAGDKNQQIMSDHGKILNPFESVKELLPDLVHITLRTNCRSAPSLANRIPEITGLAIDISKHRMPESTEGGLEVVQAKDGKESKALAEVLRGLLETYRPSDIRILSPFGASSSLVGGLFTRESASADERWLKTQLRDPNSINGIIRWRSIQKFKGLESDVVVITDINKRAQDFAQSTGRTLSELLYVGTSRAKFKCVVIASEGTLPGVV
jgi:hypothetical protein